MQFLDEDDDEDCKRKQSHLRAEEVALILHLLD